MNIRKTFAALTAVGLAAFAVPSVANAGVTGQGVFEVRNAQLTLGTGVQLDISNLGASTLVNQASAGASLNGIAVPGGGDLDAAITEPFIDPALACGGDCAGIGENNFNFTPNGPPLARADTLFEGSLVTGAIAGVNTADSRLVNEVKVDGSDRGAANSATGSTGSFTFTYDGPDTTLTLDFLVNMNLQVSTDADGGSISLSPIFSITFRDITNGNQLSWAPGTGLSSGVGAETINGDLNTAVAAGGVNDSNQRVIDNAAFSVTTGFNLVDGNTYVLTLDHILQARGTSLAVQVPEPGTLGLLGGGLIALGAAGIRRRRQKDAT